MDKLPSYAVLSVSDVERLAKAGVKMEWSEIKNQVRPDLKPSPAEASMFDCSKLLRPLVARLKQAYDNASRNSIAVPFEDSLGPDFLSAAAHGDKVYVFVASRHGPPIILEDESHLYPSDALMAKLHLMDKFHRGSK